MGSHRSFEGAEGPGLLLPSGELSVGRVADILEGEGFRRCHGVAKVAGGMAQHLAGPLDCAAAGMSGPAPVRQ